MDPTKDPCEDFFQYACGTWNKKHVIPEDRSSISTFEVSKERKTEKRFMATFCRGEAFLYERCSDVIVSWSDNVLQLLTNAPQKLNKRKKVSSSDNKQSGAIASLKALKLLSTRLHRHDTELLYLHPVQQHTQQRTERVGVIS